MTSNISVFRDAWMLAIASLAAPVLNVAIVSLMAWAYSEPMSTAIGVAVFSYTALLALPISVITGVPITRWAYSNGWVTLPVLAFVAFLIAATSYTLLVLLISRGSILALSIRDLVWVGMLGAIVALAYLKLRRCFTHVEPLSEDNSS